MLRCPLWFFLVFLYLVSFVCTFCVPPFGALFSAQQELFSEFFINEILIIHINLLFVEFSSLCFITNTILHVVIYNLQFFFFSAKYNLQFNPR